MFTIKLNDYHYQYEYHTQYHYDYEYQYQYELFKDLVLEFKLKLDSYGFYSACCNFNSAFIITSMYFNVKQLK